MGQELVRWGNIRILETVGDSDIDGLEKQEMTESGVDFIRVRVNPDDTKLAEELGRRGYFFADRYIRVRVRVGAANTAGRDRFDLAVNTGELMPEEIAGTEKVFCEAFVRDRRFHLGRHYDMQLAREVIHGYVDAAVKNRMPLVVCRFKGQLIGCLYLQRTDNRMEIFLAAVLPEYQGSGAAAELYRAAVRYAVDQGVKILTGRISSANTAVLGLYAQLGASFSGAEDEYVKDVRNE